MIPDTPINPKLVASITLTFITMLIIVPMYYTVHEQRILLSRIEYTRESNGFVLRRLQAQINHKNISEALLDPSQTNSTQTDGLSRLLRPDYGKMNKVHLRKQNPALDSKEKAAAAEKKSDATVTGQ